MIVLNKTNLAYARTALLLKQKDLAERAGVSQVTIARCESGGLIQLLTAQKILAALNAVRTEKGLTPMTLENIDWNIVR